MQNPTPTRQELSSYFFDRCTPEISNKVERWFFKNGNSQEAKKLLFSLWEELEDTTSSTSPEEIQAAFEQFKARLLSSAPQENKSKKPNLFLWIQRIAAILILPLIIFSGYLFYQHQKEENIVWIEKSAGYGDIKHITLPDNTTVWLNAGSTIIYPEEFIGRFRQIFFTGEGHFSVAKNKEKPFIIKSNESSIEVLGTQFNLKSYSNDNRIEVALLDGSVAFCYPSTTDQEMKCILSPGEQVYYNRTTHNLEKKNFILSDYSSWKDGKYYFKNETLENIAKQLERNFDVNIIIKNDSLKQIPYHMAFVNNETLDDILSAMNLDGYLTIKLIYHEKAQNSSLRRHCREMQERHNPIFIMLRLYGIRTKHICQLPEYNSRKSFGNSSESRRVFFLCQNK